MDEKKAAGKPAEKKKAVKEEKPFSLTRDSAKS